MRQRFTFLVLACIALAGCDIPRDEVALNDGNILHFKTLPNGSQAVLLCRYDSCKTAPDNEYKTARGLTVPVRNGRISYAEQPALSCTYKPIGDREHLDCKGKR